MRNTWIIFLTICILTEVFSQQASSSLKSHRTNYDSLWYWYPFSIDLSIGSTVPIGELSVYQNPGLFIGGGLGISLTQRIRFNFLLKGNWSTSRKPIQVIVDGKSEEAFMNGGGGFEGSLTRLLYQNKFICAEALIGISKDYISTTALNPNPKDKYDSLLSIKSWGLSVGIITWFNTFRGLNFGLKTEYTYSNNDRSKLLLHSIGGHSGTFALVYRPFRRKAEYKKYY